jgi:hypothetical protein
MSEIFFQKTKKKKVKQKNFSGTSGKTVPFTVLRRVFT